MARSKKRFPDCGARSILPNQAPEIIRDLARWAVATSLAAGAGCGGRQGGDDLSQTVPASEDRTLVPDGGQADGSGSESNHPESPVTTPTNHDPSDERMDAGSSVPDSGDEPEWVRLECSSNRQVFELVELTRKVDYAAGYSQYPAGLSGFPPGTPPTLDAGTGYPAGTRLELDRARAAAPRARSGTL